MKTCFLNWQLSKAYSSLEPYYIHLLMIMWMVSLVLVCSQTSLVCIYLLCKIYCSLTVLCWTRFSFLSQVKYLLKVYKFICILIVDQAFDLETQTIVIYILCSYILVIFLCMIEGHLFFSFAPCKTTLWPQLILPATVLSLWFAFNLLKSLHTCRSTPHNVLQSAMHFF